MIVGFNRRRFSRCRTSITIITLRPVGLNALAVDLGPAGLGLEGTDRLLLGSRVVLRPEDPDQGEALPAQVRWATCVRRGRLRYGLSFLRSPTDVLEGWVGRVLSTAGLGPESLADRRRFIRFAVRRWVEVAAGDKRGDCMLCDVSLGGARLLSSLELATSTRLDMRLGGVAFPPCTLVGRRPSVYGKCSYSVRFDYPMDQEALACLAPDRELARREAW